jgi:hypothetical protein
MEGTGADFHVVWLQDDATISGPVIVQGQDEALEGAARVQMIGRITGHGRPDGETELAKSELRPS